MNTQDIVAVLESKGCHPRKVGDNWTAKCPGHDDGTASLTITPKPGLTLWYCHAGCDTEAALAKIGLKKADLYDGPKPPRNGETRRIVATYDYRDEAGKLIFQCVRFLPKDFSQRQPDPAKPGRWIWNLKGVQTVLFRLPELLAAVARGLPVFVCEGEKDCLAMVQRGFAATCNPMGGGKWRDHYGEALAGADVIVIADKDQTGREHAAAVAASLQGKAHSVKVLEVPDAGGKPCKDAADFFGAGGTADELIALTDATPAWTPTAAPLETPAPEGDEAPPARGRELPEIEDMAGMLANPEPTPAVIVDGILHAGTKFVVGGGSKSFKTWVLLDLAASVATGSPWWTFPTHQGRVLYINMEIPGAFFTKRLAAILEAKGVSLQPGQLDHWPLRGHAVGIELLLPEILTRLSREKYALVLLDPIYKLYGGRDENAAGDVATLLNALERVAVQSGAAVGFGSHFAKGNSANKEAIDRISGSGVFARDPDSILTMTPHQIKGVFVIDPILRNFPPVDPFCVQWEFPLMMKVDENPEHLKRPAGRPKQHRIEDILSCFQNGTGLALKDWINSAKEKHGIGSTRFYELKAEAIKTRKVRQSPVDDLWHLLR